eukprot:1923503-Alexandrium_andersonii.AAC.1
MASLFKAGKVPREALGPWRDVLERMGASGSHEQPLRSRPPLRFTLGEDPGPALGDSPSGKSGKGKGERPRPRSREQSGKGKGKNLFASPGLGFRPGAPV